MFNLQDWHVRAISLGAKCSPEKIAALFSLEGFSVSVQTITRVLEENNVPIRDIETTPLIEVPLHFEPPKERYHVEITSNTATVDTSGVEVKTVDELLEKMKIDMNVWYVVKSRAGSYTTPIKLRSKAGGAQHAVQVTNYVVNAELLRRKPVDLLWDPIAPVELATPLKREVSVTTTTDGKALIIPDIHFGYSMDPMTGRMSPIHSRTCLDVYVQIATVFDFDQIIFVGDMLDMSEWSTKWSSQRDMMFTTQAALVECLWWLSQFRLAAPKAKMVILEGNHDNRLLESVQKNHMAAAGLRPADNLNGPEIMSMERLMGLHSVDVEYKAGHPENAYYICDSLRVIHGMAGGVDPTKFLSKRLETISTSEICGHSHKLAKVYKTDWDREGAHTRYAMCCGCAIDIGGPIPKQREWSSYNWQNGFGVVVYNEDGDSKHHTSEVHEIISGKSCFFGGTHFVGRDRQQDLFNDTNFYALRP